MIITTNKLISTRSGFKQLLKGSVLGRLFGVASNLILTRVLGVNGFGAISLYLQLIQTCEMLSRLGLDYSLSYWTAPDPALKKIKSKHLVLTALRISLVLSSLSVAAAGIYVSVPELGFPLTAGAHQLVIPLQVFLLSGIFTECLASLPWELMLIQQKVKQTTLRQILFGPLKLISASVGAVFWQVEGAMAGWAIGSAVQLAWLSVSFPFRELPSGLPGRISRRCTSLLMSKGFLFYSSNLLSQLVFFPLLLAVAKTAGVNDVGFLRIGQICAQIFGLLSGAIAPILFIKLRASSDSTERMRLLNKSLTLSWLASLTIFGSFCLVDRMVVSVGFGSAYLAGIPATRMLISCTVLDSLNQILQQSLLAKGKAGQFSLIQNTSCIVSAMIGWLLVPHYGLMGFLVCRGIYSLLPVTATFIVSKILQPELVIDWRLTLGTVLMLMLAIQMLFTQATSWGQTITIMLCSLILILCLDKAKEQRLFGWRWG